jgi:hypothetical protein
MEENNKIRIKLLSYDEKGNLTDTVSNTLKNNILSYLSEYRMINDYLDIVSGEVIDLALEVDLVVDKNESQSDIIKSAIESIIEFFRIEKRKMGDPLMVGQLSNSIGNVPGVENVVKIRVFNKIGNEYSSAQVSQSYEDTATKEIRQTNSVVFMKNNQIFQIRFPNKDIKIRVQTLGSTTY